MSKLRNLATAFLTDASTRAQRAGLPLPTDHITKLAQTIENGGVSATAYGPLLVRWALHLTGARPDAACDKLVRALPGVSSRMLALLPEQASRLSKRALAAIPSAAYPTPRPSTVATAMTHRTEFFDVAMCDWLETVEQVVLLGAGWDTRAYSLLKDAEVTIFEVDAVGTQTVKQQALAQAGIDVGNVVFISADFNQEPWLETLTRGGFSAEKPTFFLWEGVTYYLDEAAIKATFDDVATCANGSAIAFDYFSDQFVAGKGSLAARATSRGVSAAGEPFRFGISTAAPAREQVANLLLTHNLKLDRFEPLGRQAASKQPFGGLALAVVQKA